MQDPVEAVLGHAVARGYLSPAQVAQARAQGGASGSSPLFVVRGWLTAAQMAELTEVHRRAAAGFSPGAPSSGSWFQGSSSGSSSGGFVSSSGGASSDEVPTARLGGPLQEEDLGGVTKAPGGTAMFPGLEEEGLGGYVIERELARGGMGVVSIARHKQMDRRVALKQMLLSGPAEPEQVRRFEREAEAAAALRHPNIVGVYDAGAGPDGPWLAMELVEGRSLQDWIEEEGPLEERQVVEWLVGCARGVELAHSKGFLHRDLKPDNVLIDSEGVPKVTDFGLAKDLQAQERLTQTGASLGTPGFLAPEQADGAEVDTRADVYGLGATLYAGLAGRAPFQGATPMNLIAAVLTELPDRLEEQREGLSADVVTIVHRCLEFEARDRYPSVEALREDLERWLRGEPIVARAPTRRERFARWRRRYPRRFTAWTVGLVGLVGVSVLGWVAWSRAARDPEVLFSETNRAFVTERRVQVEGHLAGGDASDATYWVNGAEVSARTEGSGFSVAVALEEEGAATVEVRLGEEVLGVWTVEHDARPPRLVQPTFEVDGEELVVRGTLSEVGCAVQVNEVPAEVEEDTFVWRQALSSVSERGGYARVEVEDRAGRVASASLSVLVLESERQVNLRLDTTSLVVLRGGEHQLWMEVVEGADVTVCGLEGARWKADRGTCVMQTGGSLVVRGVEFEEPGGLREQVAVVVVEGGTTQLERCRFTMQAQSSSWGMRILGGEEVNLRGCVWALTEGVGVEVNSPQTVLELEDCRFEGEWSAFSEISGGGLGLVGKPAGVRVVRAERVEARGVRFQRMASIGFAVGEDMEGPVSVVECAFVECFFEGFSTQGTGTVEVIGCRFERQRRKGLWLRDGSLRVEGCVFVGNGTLREEQGKWTAIHLYIGETLVEVVDCVFEGNAMGVIFEPPKRERREVTLRLAGCTFAEGDPWLKLVAGGDRREIFLPSVRVEAEEIPRGVFEAPSNLFDLVVRPRN